MWARNFEAALGMWLAISPFVFRHADARWDLWTNDLVCAALIVVLSLSTYWRPLRRAHLLELAVAGWLVGYGWIVTWTAEAAPPAAQNHILVGLLVGMLAIIPSWASQPPEGWRDFRGEPGG